MSISLTPETESRLREQAERIGKDPDSLAEVLIADGLSNGTFLDDPDDLTDDEVAKICSGIHRGLKAEAEGRVKPLAQAVAEARQRHGFPDSWAS